jgi:hypothetical protein
MTPPCNGSVAAAALCRSWERQHQDRNGWQPSRGFQLAGAAPTPASAASAAPFNVGNTPGPVAGGLAIAAGYGYAAPSWIALVLWWKDSHP